jgi:hypothetical protein
MTALSGVGQYVLERWLAMTPNHGVSPLLDGPRPRNAGSATLSFPAMRMNDFALGFQCRIASLVSAVSSLCTPRH